MTDVTNSIMDWAVPGVRFAYNPPTTRSNIAAWSPDGVLWPTGMVGLFFSSFHIRYPDEDPSDGPTTEFWLHSIDMTTEGKPTAVLRDCPPGV